MAKARVFTDLHEGAVRPTSVSPDIFIDDGAGSLNTALSGLTGWSGIPSNIRQGWNSRSSQADKNTWTSITSPSGNRMFSVHLLDSTTGYAVGIGGELWEWDGTTWTSITSPSADSMFGVHLLDSTTGYAVGDALWEWDGTTWRKITKPSGDQMVDVHLLDSTTGYAVGVGGALWEWDGTTWTSITSPSADSMFGIHLLNSSTGYAVGVGGALWEWDGTTWTNITNPSSNTMRSVHLLDSTTGYAVGDGALWEWDGTTWTNITSPSADTMQSVHLLDSTTGYAVGDALWEWDGTTWTSITSPSADSMFGIHLLNSSTGYAVGDALWEWYGTALTTGQDNSRRIAWFYMNESGGTYSPSIYDGSTYSYIVTELVNAQAQTGTQKWIKWFPFTDVNGYPTSINYDLGGGTQSYCGWGIEYQNENANGYLQNQKLVLIRDFTYPASPDDTITATVDTLLSLTSVNVSENQYSVIRIVVNSNIVTNAVYGEDDANNKPDYDNQITTESTAITTAVTDTILSNTWCEGGILGEGGSATTDGNGLIDNIRFLTL